MTFYTERRPSPSRDGDDTVPVNARTLKDVNARIRAATPAYRLPAVNTKIRTAAVQRHRARKTGGSDFASASEYIEFITGTESS